MSHILVGKDLVLKIDQIVSANISATDKNDKPCIKVTLENGVEWTVYSELEISRRRLKSIANKEDSDMIIKKIKSRVYRSRVGRESNLSKEIKEILQAN